MRLPPYPLRDESEKNEGFPSQARPAKVITLQKIVAHSLRVECMKENPRLFRARHVAGERVA